MKSSTTDENTSKTAISAPSILLLAAIMAAAAVASFSASGTAEAEDDINERDGWLNDVDYYVGEEDAREEIRTGLLEELAGAEERIDAAIAELDDDELRQALIDAADRGVDVRVVADAVFEGDEEFAPLVDHDDIDVVFGDGELAYLPDPNLSPILEYCDQDDTEHDDHRTCTQSDGEADDQSANYPKNTDNVMRRPAHYNVMSHTFFLIDTTVVWNITAPMNDEQPVWFAFRAMSEELFNSFEREFRQMHGGVFSTTLSVYNGPLKSMTHQDPLRFTNRGMLRVRFNPQERLVKNVIDETFRARASVFLMTENLTNVDLIRALRYKQDNGFDVRILVGQGQAQTLGDVMVPLDIVEAPAEMGRLPTVVILDSERDRNGDRQPRQVQVLSHELMRAEPFEIRPATGADHIRFYPSDTFADGVLWEIDEAGVQRNPAADVFVDTWEEMWSQANDE